MIPCGVKQATIASGANQSNEINLECYRYFSLQMPSDWTTANITLLGSLDYGGDFYPVYDDTGTEISITAAASRIISVNAAALKIAPLKYIKLRSGTAATPINQTAMRTINIICKE